MQFVDAMKAVQQEIESGVSSKVPIADRIREGLANVRDLQPNQWGMLVLAVSAAAALVFLVLTRWDMPAIVTMAVLGWMGYRFVKNRPRRLIRQFAAKIGKMEAVKLVACRDREVTIVVGGAQKRRINGFATGRPDLPADQRQAREAERPVVPRREVRGIDPGRPVGGRASRAAAGRRAAVRAERPAGPAGLIRRLPPLVSRVRSYVNILAMYSHWRESWPTTPDPSCWRGVIVRS